MEANIAIGKRIVMLCQERKIALDELALKMSIDPRILMLVINGSVNSVSLDFIGKVCLALEITMSEFFHHRLFDT